MIERVHDTHNDDDCSVGCRRRKGMLYVPKVVIFGYTPEAFEPGVTGLDKYFWMVSISVDGVDATPDAEDKLEAFFPISTTQ